MQEADVSARALDQANRRVHEWLDRRLNHDARDLAQLYRTSREKLVTKMRALYDLYLADEPTYVRARLTGALASVNNAIDLDVQQLTDEVGQRALSHITGTLADQAGVVNRHLGKRVGLFPDLPISARNVFGDLTTSIVGGGTFYDHLFHASDMFKRDLTTQFRTGLLGGENFNQVRGRVQKLFGVDKLAEPKGAAYGSVKVYKNEARRQWNLLMKQQGKKNDAVTVWLCMLDDRSTPGCLSRHGMNLDDIPDTPPRHTNCRCTIGIFDADFDLHELRAEADVWLKAAGYSRKRAMMTEAISALPGWGWGHRILQPVSHIIPTDDNAMYATLPWRKLAGLPGHLPAAEAWCADMQTALAVERADSVLLRIKHESMSVKVWGGWEALRPVGATMMETKLGWVPDSVVLQPPWDETRQRLPMQVLERWPALRTITLPLAPPGVLYAMGLVSPDLASQITLGHVDEMRFNVGDDLQDLAMKLFWREGHPQDAHMLFGFVREIPRWRMIVNITTGTVLYGDEPFADSIQSVHTHVAGAVLERRGTIWAVRLRGSHAGWVLPGGYIDPGETPRDAIVREINEETGLTVRPRRLLGRLYRPWSTSLIFLCERVGEPGEILTRNEIDAAMAIPFAHLATDERLFLTRHGAVPQLQEAGAQ